MKTKGINRRGFLGSMTQAPLAAKIATEGQVAELMGVRVDGLKGGTHPPGNASGDSTPDQWARAFRTALFKDTARSMLYEMEHTIWALDVDLASKRSFSMAAKLTFQRQRNVERRLELIQKTPAWLALTKRLKDWL